MSLQAVSTISATASPNKAVCFELVVAFKAALAIDFFFDLAADWANCFAVGTCTKSTDLILGWLKA